MVKNTEKTAFWTAVDKTPAQYPWLDEDIHCDVAIVGGGVTAALCALRFAEAGMHPVLLSASPIGHGGTSVCSGIMTLTGEDSLTCLVDKIGADRAMSAVSLMEEAMDNLEKMAESFKTEENIDCGFKRMDSLRYTDTKQLEGTIRQEYSLQLHNGLVAELLSPITASEQFTFPIEAGVYTKGVAAQMDPYQLVHAAAAAAGKKGARIFENTGVSSMRAQVKDGEYCCMELFCRTGHRVEADYVIVADGMETENHCGGYEQVRTTYMVVTEPVEEFAGWRGPCVIHREGESRLYLTVTPDNRILIGGLDSSLIDEKGRLGRMLDLSSLSEKRFEMLERILRDMFPAIRNLTPEYVFAARDGRTHDGLPVIGRLPEKENKEAASHVAYALCCGDNGILHGEIASRLLLDQLKGVENHQLGLFSPNRCWRIKK